jgi:hypothetical protein
MDPSYADYEHFAYYHQYPLSHLERRVEELDFTTDSHYRVLASQQFTTAPHSKAVPDTDITLPIPLGNFRKGRLPDLKAYSESGSRLPILSRDQRSTFVAMLYLAPRHDSFTADLSDEDRGIAEDLWSFVFELFSSVVISTPEQAWRQILNTYRDLQTIMHQLELLGNRVVARRLAHILTDPTFWTDLSALADATPIVAAMPGRPGQTYVVTMEYTERFSYRGQKLGWESRLAHFPSAVWRWALARLGIISTGIYRDAANLGRVASLWVVVTPPEGVEGIRAFWLDSGDIASSEEMGADVGDKIAVGRYSTQPMKNDDEHGMVVDLQIRPGVTLWTSIALVGFTSCIAAYLYRQLPVLPTPGSGRALDLVFPSLFTGIPATLVGVIASRSQSVGRRIGPGLRISLALIAAQAAFLATLMGLEVSRRIVPISAWALTVSALFVTGILLLIQLGPRWRKTLESRLWFRTRYASPAVCRRSQRYEVSVLLIIWVALCVSVALGSHVIRNGDPSSARFWIDLLTYGNG